MDKKLVLPSLVFYLLGLLALLSPLTVNAADRPLEKIRIAYTGISGAQIPHGWLMNRVSSANMGSMFSSYSSKEAPWEFRH